MKVIYCPPGVDPLVLARQHRQRGGSSTLLSYWWVAAVLAFLVITVVGRPFEKRVSRPGTEPVTPTAEIAVQNALVQEFQEFAGYCHNPAGGWFPPGANVYLTDGDQILSVRCNDGTWETQTTMGPAETP